MPTNQHVTIDTGLNVLRSGISHRDPEEASCFWYVVLDRAEAERFLGHPLGMEGQLDEPGLAEQLTGWAYSYSGPGRSFSGDPCYRLYGKKVIVTQHHGLDV